jgi:short-subunit dehydrogenase
MMAFQAVEILNQVVLITGASRGIGAACASAFRSRGARLCLTARDASAVAGQSAAGDLAIAGDITSSDFREHLVAATVERFGRIDILVNNAGAGVYWPPSSAPLDEVRELFELNVFAPLAMAQLVLPHMRKQSSGFVVNISSMGGEVVLPWISVYCASKFALSALSTGLRSDLAGAGIHMMTVCPGYVDTDFKSRARGPRPPERIMGSPSGPFSITPAQCAEAILRGVERNARFVVTPRAGWLLIAAHRLFPRLVESRLTAFMKSARNEAAQ